MNEPNLTVSSSTPSATTESREIRDVKDVVDAVSAAAAASEPLRIRAQGTWLDGGRPVAAASVLDVSALSGIIEYVPGDLTLTAHAATPLSVIEEATREHNQWLPLDPYGSRNGTLGATIATSSAGPLAATVGMPRDVALGLEVVTGRGEVITAGGRVVKNVAGYDLVRLQIGAWGTLGVLTKATVRLRGLPERDATFVVRLPDNLEGLQTLLARLRQAGSGLLAAELISADLAAGITGESEACALIRIGGNESLVQSRREALAALGDIRRVDGSTVWSALRSSEPPGSAVVRVSGVPAGLAELWGKVTTSQHSLAHAAALRGVVRIFVNDKLDPAELMRLSQFGRMIIEKAPASIWSTYPVPTRATATLEERMRLAFDPAGILNPGILGT